QAKQSALVGGKSPPARNPHTENPEAEHSGNRVHGEIEPLRPGHGRDSRRTPVNVIEPAMRVVPGVRRFHSERRITDTFSGTLKDNCVEPSSNLTVAISAPLSASVRRRF